jgi:hypothetical protein
MTTNAPQAPAHSDKPVANQAFSFTSLGVKNTNINTGPGITLNDQQQLAVGSVLDV